MAYIPYNDKQESFDKYNEPELHLNALLKARLVEFDIPVRQLTILEKAGIKTLRDLTDTKRSDILAIPQFGKGSIVLIDKLMERYKLSFAGE